VGRPRQSKRRGRQPPDLVIGLPLRGRDGRRMPPPSRSGRLCAQGAVGDRIPVHQRLGPWVPDVVAHLPRHRRFSPPDSDGWTKVLPHQSSRPARLRTTASRQDLAPRRCFSVPPPRAIEPTSDTSPPSTTAAVQESVSTNLVEPTNGDIAMPASPASSEDRLAYFLDAIQKKLASPLLATQTRPARDGFECLKIRIIRIRIR
jgi:hypothetical protein